MHAHAQKKKIIKIYTKNLDGSATRGALPGRRATFLGQRGKWTRPVPPPSRLETRKAASMSSSPPPLRLTRFRRASEFHAPARVFILSPTWRIVVQVQWLLSSGEIEEHRRWIELVDDLCLKSSFRVARRDRWRKKEKRNWFNFAKIPIKIRVNWWLILSLYSFIK